jgi:hypothetical protein
VWGGGGGGGANNIKKQNKKKQKKQKKGEIKVEQGAKLRPVVTSLVNIGMKK